jgi:hypothetical protein
VGYLPIVDRPDLEDLFGAMSRETAAAVLNELLSADELLVRIASAFGPEAQHQYEDVRSRNRLGLNTTHSPDIDASVSGSTEISNEDGTKSHPATDLSFLIDGLTPYDGRRSWIVTTRVAVNCNRRHCANDPHESLRIVGEATSPLGAVRILNQQIEDLDRWIASQEDDRWRIFRHIDG